MKDSSEHGRAFGGYDTYVSRLRFGDATAPLVGTMISVVYVVAVSGSLSFMRGTIGLLFLS